MQPEEFADLVVVTVKAALAPVLERLAVAEARLSGLPTVEKTLTELRDRVVIGETKSAMPVQIVEPPPVDLAPVLERLAVSEAKLAALGDVRDRLIGVETNVAQPPLQDTTINNRIVTLEAELRAVHARLSMPDPLDSALAKAETQLRGLTSEYSALRERVAVVEVRPPVPGPPGEPGPAGKDGADGKDGTAGLSFEGVYQDGKSYDFGQLVTFAGSSWHCNEATTSKPGDGSKAWTLMVKRGRDGKDGRDAGSNGLPVVRTQ